MSKDVRVDWPLLLEGVGEFDAATALLVVFVMLEREVLGSTTTNTVVVDGSAVVVVVGVEPKLVEGEELEDRPTADMQLPIQYGAAT